MELSDYTLDLDDMENGRWLKVVDDFYVKARSLQSCLLYTSPSPRDPE